MTLAMSRAASAELASAVTSNNCVVGGLEMVRRSSSSSAVTVSPARAMAASSTGRTVTSSVKVFARRSLA